MRSRISAPWLAAAALLSFLGEDGIVHGNDTVAAARRRLMRASAEGKGGGAGAAFVSPTDLTFTSRPSPADPPAGPRPSNVPDLQQSSFLADESPGLLPFACIPPQITKICTATAPDSTEDECYDVGEPCPGVQPASSSHVEHCCVDYCGRKYCTAKSWFDLDNNDDGTNAAAAADTFADEATFGFVGDIDGDELRDAVDLNLSMNVMDDEGEAEDDGSGLSNSIPTPHPTKKPRVGRTRRPSRGNNKGEDTNGPANDETPPLEQNQVLSDQPTNSPNNNIDATVPPTIIVTRPDTLVPTAASTGVSTIGSTPSLTVDTEFPTPSLTVATEFPTLPPAPFFMPTTAEPSGGGSVPRPTARPTVDVDDTPVPTEGTPVPTDTQSPVSGGVVDDVGGGGDSYQSDTSRSKHDGGGGWSQHAPWHTGSGDWNHHNGRHGSKSRKSGKRAKGGHWSKWSRDSKSSKSGKSSKSSHSSNDGGGSGWWGRSSKSGKSSKSSKSSSHDSGGWWSHRPENSSWSGGGKRGHGSSSSTSSKSSSWQRWSGGNGKRRWRRGRGGNGKRHERSGRGGKSSKGGKSRKGSS